MFKSNPFYMKVYGAYALFTDNLSKGGGEKFSYQVPTFQALKGIVEACYWKPSLYYIIDEVKIINRIKTQTKSILSPLDKYGDKDRNYFTYLQNVEYAIKFHFEWNEARPDLKVDWQEKKHEQILLRSMQRGGRRDIFLGTRECVGFIERLREHEYESLETAYEGRNISLGIMFHSFSYPQTGYDIKSNELISNYTPIVMKSGIISFCRPEDCKIHHNIGQYKVRKFTLDDFRTIDEEKILYDEMKVGEIVEFVESTP